MLRIPPERPVDPLTAQILRVISRVLEADKTPYFLIGATARDMLLWNVHGLRQDRATRDIDIAIAAASWVAFNRIKDALLAIGDFRAQSGSVQRLYYSRPDDTRKHGDKRKDAQDLAMLLSSYEAVGNHRRLVGSELSVFEAAGYDLRRAGAHLLGVDARANALPRTATAIELIVTDDVLRAVDRSHGLRARHVRRCRSGCRGVTRRVFCRVQSCVRVRMLLVDTGVLLDVLQDDPAWANWSIKQLRAQSQVHELCINPVIYSELSLTFQSVEALDAAVEEMGLTLQELPKAALFLAARAFIQDRRRGGLKNNELSDLFIGAHAAVLGCGILTRDGGRYGNYFPSVALLIPEEA